MPRFPQVTRDATPAPAAVDSGAAALGAAARSVGAAGQQLAGVVADAGLQFARQRISEAEQDARVAAADYEVELQQEWQRIEQEEPDHNKREELFRDAAKVARDAYADRWSGRFMGRASEIFDERANLVTERQELVVRQNVWNERVRVRRGAVLRVIDQKIQVGSGLPEAMHSVYLAEIDDELSRAVQDNLLPEDEAARLRISARTQLRTRFESLRVSREADQVVQQALAIRGLDGTDEDPDGEATRESVAKMLAEIDDGEVRDLALRRWRALEAQREVELAQDRQRLYDQATTDIANGDGHDAIPAGLTGSQQQSLERYADYVIDRQTEGKLTDIETVPEVYDRVMGLLTTDREAFLEEDVYALRMELANADFNFFLGAQAELRAGAGRSAAGAAAPAYASRPRWLAAQRIDELERQGLLLTEGSEPEDSRGQVHLDLYDSLNRAREQRRTETGNAAYELSEDEARRAIDIVLLNRRVEVPIPWWPDGESRPADLTVKDLGRIQFDLDHPIHRDVINEAAAEGETVEPGSARVRILIRERLEMLGADFGG